MKKHAARYSTAWAAVAVILLALALGACKGSDSASAVSRTQTSSAVATGPIAAGEICPSGGVQVDTGIDSNGNGKLDPDEIDDTVYVCNGIPGLVTAAKEPKGGNCSEGGTRIDSGLDVNGDNKLQKEEILNTSYACNADIIAPVVPALDPYDDTLNTLSAVLSGSKEPFSTIWVNGVELIPIKDVRGFESKSWSVKVALAVEGKNVFTIYSTDEPGNESGGVIAVIIRDTVPPDSRLLTVDLVPGVVTSTVLALRGTKEAGTGIQASVNRLRPQLVAPVDLEGAWKGEIKLPEGKITLEIAAIDDASNLSKPLSYSLLVDYTPPAFTVDMATVMSPTTSSATSFGGTKEAGASIWINGKEYVPLTDLNTGWKVRLPLVEGSNVFNVTSRDQYGNESAPSVVTIARDTVAYDVTNLTATTTDIGGGNISVTFNWLDPDPATETVEVIVLVRGSADYPAHLNDGTGVDKPGPGVQTVTDNPTPPLSSAATHYYALFVIDTAGNVSPGVRIAVVPPSPGALDTSFDADGFALDSGRLTLGARGNAIMVDPLGRGMLVTGAVSAKSDDMALWLVTGDGSIKIGLEDPDPACCPYGKNPPHDAGNAVTADPFGKFIVVAGAVGNGAFRQMALWRFISKSLALDELGFGRGGRVIFDWSSVRLEGLTDTVAHGVAMDAKGRIFVTGTVVKKGGDLDMVVWAFDEAGNLDSRFGTNGVVIIGAQDGGTNNDVGRAIAVDASGRIVVAGYTGPVAGNSRATLWRFTPSGAADLTFNKSGQVSAAFAAGTVGPDEGRALVLDITVKPAAIMMAGSSHNGTDLDAAVWRFLDDGTPATWGTAGAGFTVLTRNPPVASGADVANGIAVDGKGKPVVAGSSSNGANDDLIVWRLLPDGLLDTVANGGTGFSNPNGYTVDDRAAQETANGVAVDASRRIVPTGSTGTTLNGPTSDEQMIVWRLLP